MTQSSLNPLRWPKEHIIALAVAAVLGCLCGLVAGYVVSSDRNQLYYMGEWGPVAAYLFDVGLSHNVWGYYDGRSLEWGLFGTAVGGILVYIRQLLSR